MKDAETIADGHPKAFCARSKARYPSRMTPNLKICAIVKSTKAQRIPKTNTHLVR